MLKVSQYNIYFLNAGDVYGVTTTTITSSSCSGGAADDDDCDNGEPTKFNA
jgi:hypothetical protein